MVVSLFGFMVVSEVDGIAAQLDFSLTDKILKKKQIDN
jgi:hypothetical protein